MPIVTNTLKETNLLKKYYLISKFYQVWGEGAVVQQYLIFHNIVIKLSNRDKDGEGENSSEIFLIYIKNVDKGFWFLNPCLTGDVIQTHCII